ncbi:MAG: EVE domain-containing protein [Bacteroidetes bacterium]|nr:EVE domain-containing protein [Bacteroidota bacterium]
MEYWLLKSEPNVYSWEQLVHDKETIWDGVRNYAARLNLMGMKKGDMAFFYHSNAGMEIVGIVKISKTYFQDPSTEDERWVSVCVKPFKKLHNPVALAAIKNEKDLAQMDLVRLGRLSVQKVQKKEWEKVLEMSHTKI